jgi:hypothetical protein
MLQRTVPRAADAIHALLPMVSNPGETAVEIAWQRSQMPLLPLGHRGRFLELLRMVP